MTAGQRGGVLWLASYPKSGNTWARIALLSLREGGAHLDLNEVVGFFKMPTTRLLFDKILEVEAGNLRLDELEFLRPALHDAIAALEDEPQLLKVHDHWFRNTAGRPIFDRSHTHGAIYIIRDPRDVAISWARFSSRSIDWGIGNLADPASQMASSRTKSVSSIAQRLGHWSAHVTSWIDESGLAPLVVRYEDMHADLAGTLARMADYIGWTTSPEAIAGAIEASRFDRLAAQEQQISFSEMPDTASQFFVSGRAGGWRDILTPEQAATIERDHGAVMRRFGYL
ncbi:sulfotransferase domain-containing protein [soil metagenome]